jgi:hypothetical protein
MAWHLVKHRENLTFTFTLLTHSHHGAGYLKRLLSLNMSKKYSVFFMEFEGSLPYSQKPTTGPYPELTHGKARPQVADGGKASRYGG